VGTGWIAVATSQNRLRLYSTGGVQKHVYDLAGSIVAVSAFEDLLFVVFHHGIGKEIIYYSYLTRSQVIVLGFSIHLI